MSNHLESIEKSASQISLDSLKEGRIFNLPNGLNIFRSIRQPNYPAHEIDQMIEGSKRYIVPDIPYTGLGYEIEDELLLNAIREFGMQRLMYIPQLARLNDPDNNPEKVKLTDNFLHNRFVHSLDVLAIASVIGHNSNLNPREILSLQIATLTHDILTAAGGDTTKLIDRKAFDEDANYPDHLNHPDIQAFCLNHDIDQPAVLETISGEGALSDIRDLADKLAYVARDLQSFIAPSEAFPEHLKDLPSREVISRMLHDGTKSPYDLFSVWENMTIKDGTLVCTKPEKLFDLLNVRALLFRDLYTNPRSRYNESLINSLLTQYLYERGIIKKEALTNPFDPGAIDQHLKNLLREWFDIESRHIWQKNYDPTYASFDSPEVAREFEKKELKKGNPFVRFEDATKFFKPGTHFNVLAEDGTIMPYSEYDQIGTEKIINNGRPIDPIRVYYLETKPDLSSPEMQMFMQWRLEKVDL